MKNKLVLIAVLALFYLAASTASEVLAAGLISKPTHDAAKEAAFHDAMRQLWEDHITWTRLFIVSAVGDLPDKGATTERLIQNQVDIGNAIKAYYGDAAGEKLTALLKTHITTAAEVVAAAKANDKIKLADAQKRWYANADEIATFLNSANPKSWPLAEMKHMMHEHLDLTTKEAVAHLTGDWKTDIAAYNSVHLQILQMADMLSEGIVKQFPEKFK
jgi:hypothetical protein